MPKRKETQEKATKRQKKSKAKELEIQEEMQEETQEETEDTELNEGEDTDETEIHGIGEESIFSRPLTPERAVGLEADDMDTLYNIKTELQRQGVDLKGEVKFIICKKDDTGKYPHLKTFDATMPDFDLLGKQFGGGDYQVKIYGNGKYLMSKMFSISKESYPVNASAQAQSQAQQGQGGATIINAQPNNTGIELMLKTMSEQNNMLLQTILSKPERKDNMLDTIRVLKELMPPPAPTQQVPYEMILGMATQMFQAGITLKERIEEKDSDEGIGDVLLGMVKDLSKNLPMMMAGMQNKNLFDSSQPTATIPAQIPQATTPQAVPQQVTQGKQTEKALTPAELLALLKDFFDDVILAFESDTFVHTYHLAEKCFKIRKYHPIVTTVRGLPTDTLIKTLSAYGLQKRFDDTETEKDDMNFKQFVTQIIDIIRDFDIITLDDDGNIIKSERPSKPEVKVDDNNGEQPVGNGNGTATDTKTADTQTEPVTKQGDGV